MTDNEGGAWTPAYLLPDRAYKTLKWACLIVLPALSTATVTLGGIWGWPLVDECAQTLTALSLLGGVLIGASQLKGDA